MAQPSTFPEPPRIDDRAGGSSPGLPEPHIPIPVFSPLLFRQVCLLAGFAGMLASRYPAHGLLACVLLALLTLSFADFRKLFLFLAAFGVGFLLAFGATTAPPNSQAHPEWARAAVTPAGRQTDARFTAGVALSGNVLENTALAGNRTRLLLCDVRATGEAAPLPGNLVLTWHSPPPDLALAGPGQRLAVTVRLREIRSLANPGVWEVDTYWRDRGAFYRAWGRGDGSGNGKYPPYALNGEPSLLRQARNTLHAATIRILAGTGGDAASLSQAQAIIPALLFGDRSLCTPKTLDLVAKATLAHSLALSGMHLGFAAGIGYGAAYLLHFLFPALFLRIPRQKVGILCAAPVCLCYLWVGGAPPSLVRAALMLFFWGLLLVLHRPKVLLDGLLWAVGLILLVSPSTIFDIRLQLSAVSVAGITLAAPLLGAIARYPSSSAGRFDSALRRLLKIIAGMAVISVAAQAAVLPLVLDAFPGTGIWFPLNLLWLPVLGAWVMPASFAGLFLTALGCESVASLFFFLAAIPCEGLLFLLETMDATGILAAPVLLRPPFWTAAGYWLLLLLVPVVVTAGGFSRRSTALFCLGLVLAALPAIRPIVAETQDMVRLRLIDVGQGQAALLSWQIQGKRGRILVDGGGGNSPYFDMGRQVVAPVLTDNAAPRLNMILNSHPDADHLQGLLFPLSSFAVGSFVTGPGTFGPGAAVTPSQTVVQRDAILRRRGIVPEIRQAGDRITLAPELVLEVLHPGGMPESLSANDNALVVRIVWRGRPLTLICGDLESGGISLLLRQGSPLQADVLVLPHHGSAGSYSPKLYDAVSPSLALASCGYANQWHFPAEKIRVALAERGIPLAATADRGQIAVTWDERGVMHTSFAKDAGNE